VKKYNPEEWMVVVFMIITLPIWLPLALAHIMWGVAKGISNGAATFFEGNKL
jgi:hypothetical protein